MAVHLVRHETQLLRGRAAAVLQLGLVPVPAVAASALPAPHPIHLSGDVVVGETALDVVHQPQDERLPRGVHRASLPKRGEAKPDVFHELGVGVGRQ